MPTLLDTKRGEAGRIDRTTGQMVTESTSSPVISSSSLAPAQSFNLTPPAPATQAAGLQGYLGASATQIERERQSVNESKDDFLTSALKADTETGLTQKLYAGQVDPAEAELKDINNQLLSEQVSARHEIEALRKNPRGLFGGALQDKVDEIESRSLTKQADLAVIQMSKQGRYDSAKQIADRAVQALLEKQRVKNDALKFNYEENKELFNKDEQRTFETAQKERDRTLENEEYRLRARFDQTIKQSDPLYQAQLAKAQSDAAAAAGSSSSGAAFVNQSGFSKLSAAQQGTASKINDLNNSLADYRTSYDQLVDESGVLLAGADAALLQAKANALMFAVAQAEGTGALQAADREVIEKIVANPTSPFGAFATIFRGGKAGATKSLDDLQTKYQTSLTSTYGLKPVGPTTDSDPLQLGI